MEDDSGLELSLGLSCGGSLGKSKVRDAPSDLDTEGGIKKSLGGNVTVSDLKSFFQTGNENQDHKGKQKSDIVSVQHDNFWTDLGKCSALHADCSNNVNNNISQFTSYQDLWNSNKKTNEPEEEKSGPNKRRLPFEDINFPNKNKHEKVVDSADTHDKKPTGVELIRNSHISMTTEDVSSGENEDVAESEAEGSNSWLVSHREERAKCPDIPKFTDKHVLSESSGISPQGQKEPSASANISNSGHGKVAFGIPLSLQPLAVMTVPYPVPIKASTADNAPNAPNEAVAPKAPFAPNATGFPSPCVMQLMPVANSERPMVQAVNANNLQLAFGYPSVQLPTLETGSSWAFNSQPRNVTSFATRDHVGGAPNLDHAEEDVKTSHVPVQGLHSSLESGRYDGKSSNLVKGNGKHGEASTFSQTEDESKGKFTLFRPKEAANKPVGEGSSQEASTIKPGVATDVKFGGSGSFPHLPWVSTTGPGPNGKTISGVTYKYNQNQVKIVCACHGTHMSPEEFVQHASAADAPNPENNTALPSFPSSNSAASAKS